MRWLLPLLAAAVLTLCASLFSVGWFGIAEPFAPPARSLAVPRVQCERPGTLRLRRLEDRSARLECAGRVLVRVSVPG
jgi:hypothetical protein